MRPIRTPTGAVASRTPLVTAILIAVNTLVFGLTAAQSHSLVDNDAGSALFRDWELWPVAVAAGEYGRIIGSGFLHFGPVHLLVNMLALYIVGRDVEYVLGRGRYLAVYAVSMLGGAAAVMAFQSANSATAGASGAIFGLFGAQAMILLRLRRSPGPVVAVIAINVLISVTLPGISLWGHLGGLAAGTAASAALLFAPGGGNSAAGRRAGWMAVGAIGLLAVGVVLVRAAQLRTELGL